jgi:hypothetical protein
MDEMKLGQRTHRSAPVTMILMHMVRKGENQKRISSGLGIPGEAGHRFRSKV